MAYFGGKTLVVNNDGKTRMVCYSGKKRRKLRREDKDITKHNCEKMRAAHYGGKLPLFTQGKSDFDDHSKQKG